MTDQAAPDGDELELEIDDETEGQVPEVEAEEDEGQAGDEGLEDPEAQEFAFEGDEAAPASEGERETGLVRDLRQKLRQTQKELAAVRGGVAQQPVEVGPKPTFEGCEYDEEKFEAELLAWTERDAQVKRAEEAKQAEWQRELEQVEAQRRELKIPEATFVKARDEVREALTEVQQALLIKAVKNPAAMIAALGSSPSRLAAVAEIEDPVKLIAELVRMEGSIKMTARRKAPEPEGTVRGSAPLSRQSDKHLERLEAEADRTGDRTKVVQYKRELKAKARA